MSTTVSNNRLEPSSVADKALKAAAALWFLVAVIGQWAFLYYIVAFYGPSTFTVNFQVWNRNSFLNMAYVPGDTTGNLAFAAHTLLAAVIAFGGAMQLIPQIRARAISVHRWIGRVFFVTALGLSGSGLYMEWVRGDRFSMVGAVAISLNAVLIILFCGLAWRSALRREISTHRRWALRAYLVANAQWFTRVGVFAWIIVNRGRSGSETTSTARLSSLGISVATLCLLSFLNFSCAQGKNFGRDGDSPWRAVSLCSRFS
jgi:uncharacterized membrane protein